MERSTGESGDDLVKLSIVIAAGRCARRIDTCLGSLIPQLTDHSMEVIVSHCCNPGSVSKIAGKYPRALFVDSCGRTSLPDLLGTGIARAQGAVIAVTDETAKLDEGWVSATVRAHETNPCAVIGGAVEPSESSTIADWAAYFCDYAQFMLPLKAGFATQVPGNNLSFKRKAAGDLMALGRSGFWKAHWCIKLQREGSRLSLDPDVVVFSSKSVRLVNYLIRRFHHGRCFAGMRAAETSAARRCVYAAGSFLLPLVFFKRIAAAVIPKKRYLKEFLLCSPAIGLFVSAWSCGELCGYLFGAGESCAAVQVGEE